MVILGRMEILTGVDRRRRWSVEDKLEIVRLAFSPGSSIASVARRYDVCRSQIYQWRRAFRLGWLRVDEKAIDFHPVEICDEAPIVADAVEPSGDVEVTISLRGDRALSFSSNLSSGEIQRLVVAVEAA